MLKHNQDGAVSGVVISLVLAVLLLLGAVGFGFWAYASRQDYKTRTDQKVAAAVAEATKGEARRKDAEFIEAEKLPLRTYNGPEAYGSLVLQYPKTWSGYVSVSKSNGSGALIDGYFNPGVVPSVADQDSVFALRLQVLGQSYSEVAKSFATSGSDAPKITAYALPKLPKVVGLRLTGKLKDNKTGDMIVLPLRSQTLQIWTEGNQFSNDFNNNILPNFSFSP